MVRHLVDYVAIVELIADDTHDLDLDDDTRPRGMILLNLFEIT